MTRPITDGQPAGVVSRLLAGAVDALVLLGLLGIGYAVLTGIAFMADPVRFRFPAPSRFWCLASAMVVLVCYLTACWAATGRTYGDHVLGLRVVDGGGRVLPVVRAFPRAVLCAVFPLGLLWAAVSRRRCSVQDLLARTAVIYDWTPGDTTPRPAGNPNSPGSCEAGPATARRPWPP